MSLADDVAAAEAALLANLLGPQSVSGDAGSVTSQPIPAQIQALNYLAGLQAANSPSRGLRFNRLIPDGTVHVRWKTPRWGDGREV